MRASFEGYLIFNDEKFVGLNLGADFTSEHEHGTKDLDEAFGIDRTGKDKIGLELRSSTTLPGFIYFDKVGKTTYLIVKSYHHGEFKPKDIDGLTNYNPKDQFRAAWSNRGFALATQDKAVECYLGELFNAIESRDFAYWVGSTGGNPFGRGGLILTIPSRISIDNQKVMEEADLERRRLERAVEITGIKGKLKAANLEYFALSPKFDDDGRLIFWLNPMEQNKYQYGWYGVSELEDWAKGRGKIIRSKD